MARLGLDYERLRPLNPGLIYVSMSGYGHDGPRRDWTSMNLNLQAYTGLMTATGDASEPPVAISNSWNDYIGGLHACVGILNALSERAVSGQGAQLDLAQFECSVATLGPSLLAGLVNGSVPPRLGNRSTHAAPQGVYRCAGRDEWCAISVQTDAQWQALAAAVGEPAWATDARLASLVGRLRHQAEIEARLEAWTSELPNTEVERRLQAAGVPAARMRRIREVVEEGPRVFRPLEDPPGEQMLATGLPFTFSRSAIAPLAPAARLGEHTAEALREWLGLDAAEVETLEAQGGLV
jgi:crotonobetainyl-CoA:carnitine CoA-transferase CaiB-like acyl-CoA transferase